jgi:mRNA-degrading endonuclease RelE of RelBE toxin-antitoxin system
VVRKRGKTPLKRPEQPRPVPEITYKASVRKDLEKLDVAEATRVVTKLEETLRGEGPRGEALSGKFKGLHKLRVGDYRVIHAKTERGFLVLRIRGSLPSGRGFLCRERSRNATLLQRGQSDLERPWDGR